MHLVCASWFSKHTARRVMLGDVVPRAALYRMSSVSSVVTQEEPHSRTTPLVGISRQSWCAASRWRASGSTRTYDPFTSRCGACREVGCVRIIPQGPTSDRTDRPRFPMGPLVGSSGDLCGTGREPREAVAAVRFWSVCARLNVRLNARCV